MSDEVKPAMTWDEAARAQLVWRPSIAAPPQTLFGFPVVENPDMVTPEIKFSPVRFVGFRPPEEK